jgi:hypothetical protein
MGFDKIRHKICKINNFLMKIHIEIINLFNFALEKSNY